LLRLHAEEGDDVSPDAFREERQRMQTEIAAAEESLVETEQRLQLDADTLRMALELAEDVASFYVAANDQTKRSYNQAFFKRLFVRAEWDKDHDQTNVRITRAELTEPYAHLLRKDLVTKVMSEVELIRAMPGSAEGGPPCEEPPSDAAVSIFFKLAEREGFEPSNEVNPRYAISSRAHSTALAPLHRV
jgi:hypothetical protein